VRRPRPSTRAPREIFCCKPVSARMQRLAIGGGVIIGIVTYSPLDLKEHHNGSFRRTRIGHFPRKAFERLRCHSVYGDVMKRRSKASAANRSKDESNGARTETPQCAESHISVRAPPSAGPRGPDSISAGFTAGQGDEASRSSTRPIRLLRSRVSFRRSDAYHHAAGAQLRSQASGASYVV
jgi:hypothetical protein